MAPCETAYKSSRSLCLRVCLRHLCAAIFCLRSIPPYCPPHNGLCDYLGHIGQLLRAPAGVPVRHLPPSPKLWPSRVVVARVATVALCVVQQRDPT